MPTIDFDLHPIALAFGLFCLFLTAFSMARIVYVTLYLSPASESNGADDRPARPFVPAEEKRLPNTTDSSRTKTVA